MTKNGYGKRAVLSCRDSSCAIVSFGIFASSFCFYCFKHLLWRTDRPLVVYESDNNYTYSYACLLSDNLQNGEEMNWVYVLVGLILCGLCFWLGEYVAGITVFLVFHPWAWLQPIFRILGVVLLIVMTLMGVLKGGGQKVVK